MRRLRILPAVGAAAAVLVAGCGGGQPGRAGATAAGAETDVGWEPCPEVLVEFGLPPEAIEEITARVTLECATLAVPQDWDAPDATGTFDLALLRGRVADQSDRIGSLLVNPGGPGASGVDLAVSMLIFPPGEGGLPEEVTRRFDVVGFDPRGVGRSSPVDCVSDAAQDEVNATDPDPVEQTAFDAVVAGIQEYAEACAAKHGEALRYYSTRQTAHDLDALRAAVGDEKLSYLGFSYGTLLGATYAQLYPERVRALVLDGAVDPEQDRVAEAEANAAAFEQALDTFAEWCRQTPDECPLQPDARAAIDEALAQAREAPVPGDDGREATAGWVYTAVVATLYSQEEWPQLAEAINQLGEGDPGGVFDLADPYAGRDEEGHYNNSSDAMTAVNCADEDAELAVDQVRELQQQWREEHPVFGGPMATSLLGCVPWPVESDPYPTGPADGAPPILVIGTLGDPATPYEWSSGLAEMLGAGVVLTWEGEGHTAYPQTECVTDIVNAYLVDLTVPEAGTTCPAQ